MEHVFEQELWLATHELPAPPGKAAHPDWSDLRMRFVAAHQMRKVLSNGGSRGLARASGSFAVRAARTVAILHGRLNQINLSASTHGNAAAGIRLGVAAQNKNGGRGKR